MTDQVYERALLEQVQQLDDEGLQRLLNYARLLASAPQIRGESGKSLIASAGMFGEQDLAEMVKPSNKTARGSIGVAGNKLLLDTNAVIALQQKDADLLKFLENEEDVFIPSVVIGELYYGAYKSGRPEENRATVAAFAASRGDSQLRCRNRGCLWTNQVCVTDQRSPYS